LQLESTTAEVDQGDEGLGGMKAEAAMAEQADPVVHPFEPSVADLPADPADDAVEVVADHPGDFLDGLELGVHRTLAEQNSSIGLQRKLRLLARPALLAIDELGYLSYDSRHADLLFEVVSRRYEHKSILITTNKPLAEWGEVFPNATTVVTIVDRLVHRCELVTLDGDSYRLKESRENAKKRADRRRQPPRPSPDPR
jgi:hypothetical protein